MDVFPMHDEPKAEHNEDTCNKDAQPNEIFENM